MNAMEARISIIVTVYNTAVYLSQALDSLVNQTKPFHEIIIIDDKSTDDSLSVLRRYGSYENIKIIPRSRNCGVGAARNFGIVHATGSHACFFDSDDILDLKFVESMTALMEKLREPDIIFFSGENFDHDTGGCLDSFEFQRPCNTEKIPMINIYSYLIKGGGSVSPCLFLFDRVKWIDAGLMFRHILHEDEEIFFRIFALLDTGAIVNSVFYRRRVRSDSIMTSTNNGDKKCASLLGSIILNSEFYGSLGVVAKKYKEIYRSRMHSLAGQYFHACERFDVRPNGIAVIWSFFRSSLRPPFGLLMRNLLK